MKQYASEMNQWHQGLDEGRKHELTDETQMFLNNVFIYSGMEAYTLEVAICADGTVFDPLVVFKGKRMMAFSHLRTCRPPHSEMTPSFFYCIWCAMF